MDSQTADKPKRYKIIVSGGEFLEEIREEDVIIEVENVNLKVIFKSKINNKTISYSESELENILSNSFATEEFLSELGLNINNQEFNDFSQREKFYEVLKSLGPGKIKTSQPNYSDFKKSLEKIENYDAIVISTISSGLSGTYNVALQSVNEFSESNRNKVFVIDSKSVSKIVGLCAYNHLKKIINGELIEKDYECSKEIFMRGLIFDLRYIDVGGRGEVLKHIKSLMNTFKIIPLITLEEGKVKLVSVINGEKKSVLTFNSEITKELNERDGFYTNAVLLYTSKNTKERLSDVNKILKDKNIDVEYLCSDFVLGTHFGAESLGVLLYKK
jgi:DegV family protein with EDD domain